MNTWHDTKPRSSACPLRSSDHLLLIGDSTMRYLYLTLVELLADGPVRSWNGCTQQCFFNERTWINSTTRKASWESFFVGTAAKGRGFCDCSRGEGSFNLPNTMENRYHEACSGVRLSFLLLYRPVDGLRGTWWPGGPNEARRGPHLRFEPAWKLSLDVVGRALFPALKPSIVFINAGHHLYPLRTNQGYDEDSTLELYRRVHAGLSTDGARIVWVSTIQHRDEFPRYDEAWLARRAFGKDVLNSSEVTAAYGRDAFWDRSMHLNLRGNVELACALVRMVNAAGQTLTSHKNPLAHGLAARANAMLGSEPRPLLKHPRPLLKTTTKASTLVSA